MDNLYSEIISFENLILAWKKARKGKTRKEYVILFEQEIFSNLMALHYELKFQTYNPKPLKTFILRDPKTRKISKSDFRDRVVHHALVRIIEPIFDKSFIDDSSANRIGKGTLYALKRFDKFQRKVTKNLSSQAHCFKADIKHYFDEINHDVLMNVLEKKITDESTRWLIRKILNANFGMKRERERD